MGDSKAMVEKNNHDFSHQLGVSDDYLISKFNGDFSLKRLSPQVRLKRELHLTQTDLVPTPRGQENSGRPPENGQGLDCHSGENGVDTRQGITNSDGLDLERSNLHEETQEKTGKDSEALQPNEKSSKVVRVNCHHARTENVADREAVDIKRTRGRPRRNHKHVDDTVPESTSSSKSPVSQSTVLPPRKRGRPRKNGIPGESTSPKVSPTAVPASLLSVATKGQRNHPCKKSKLGFGAKKDQIVRNYPLRRLFHSTSKDKLVPRRFPRYTNVLVRAAQNSSTKSQKRNSTPCIGKTSQRPVEVSLGISDTLSDVKDTTQDTKESQRDSVESCRSKICGEPGETAISVDPKLNKLKNSDSETSVSSGKSSLVGLKEKRNAKKKSKNMSNLVRCHSVERLPLHPASLDLSAKIEKKEQFPTNSGKHVSESSHVYDFTDSADESLHELSPPVTNKPECNRGRPQRGKFGHAAVATLARSRMVLVHRKPCSNKSEIIPSRTLESLDIVHRKKEPQKKRGRGRPRKHRTTMFPAKKNCQKKSLKTQSVQKHYKLQEEHGCVRSNVEKGAAFTESALQQETFFGDKLPEINRNNPSYVPKLVESTQEKDVSLHNTQLNPLRDASDHKSSAMWTPCWKDKPVSEYQSGSDQVTCLTPPGSNECLSAITGDECPQTIEEPSIQKACQTPSNITTSSPSALDSDSIITLSPSSDPGLLHFHQGEAIADNSQEMPVNLGLSPSSDPGLTYFHQGETITDSSQEMPVNIGLSPSSDPGLPHFHQGETITDNSQEMPVSIDSCSPFELHKKSSSNICSGEQISMNTTKDSQENMQDFLMVDAANPVQESDGLSQIRIAKTFTLSKDQILSSCTQSEDMETHNGTNLITSQNDVPVKGVQSSSFPRRERENIFQALRGGLNSQSSNQDKDLDQPCSDSFMQQDGWQHEMMNIADPEIPRLEAYGGGGLPSHSSPHSGDSDTLPILEKETFHDTCLDDEDDDEFEFENPSDVALEFDKPSDSIVQDYSYKWPEGSGLPHSDTDIITAERVHQDLQNGANGFEEDEDEFEFETPEESDATHPYDQSPDEHPPESHIAISDSLDSKQECILDDDKHKVRSTPHEKVERQTEPVHQCDELNENQFPILGISPTLSGCSASLSGNSSPTERAEVPDFTLSQSNNMENLSITDSQENTEKMNDIHRESQEFHESQRAFHKIPSKDAQLADIITLQNDQEKSSITPKKENISKQNNVSKVPEDRVMHEMDQEESIVVDDKVKQKIDQVESNVPDDKVMQEMDQAESSVQDDKVKQEIDQVESNVPDDKVMQEMDQAENSVPDDKMMQEMDQAESSVLDDKVIQEKGQVEGIVPDDKMMQEMDQAESSVLDGKAMQEMDQVESSVSDDKGVQEMDQAESSVPHDRVVQEMDQVESSMPDDKVMQEIDQEESSISDDKVVQEKDQAESSVPDDKVMQEMDQVESSVPDDKVMQEMDQAESGGADDKVIQENDQAESSVPDDKAMQEKDQVESFVPDDKEIQKIDQEASSIPDDKVMYQRDEGEAYSKSAFEEFNIEAEVERDEWSNPAKSAGPDTSEEMSEECSQSNAPVDRKAKDEACCSTTADSSSRCQEPLPVADAEELPNSAVNKCSPLSVNKAQSKNFAVCDIEQSEEGKAPTHVYEEDIVPNGQDTTEKLSRGSNDLLVDVKPSEKSDFEVSTGEEKVITDVAEAPENNAEVDSSIMHCEETELEKGRPGGDLHITSEHCPKTPETSVLTKKETINTSKDSEVEFSNGVNVLQSSDAEVQHAESPLSKAASTELQNTLESEEDTDERTSAPSRSDDCSKVMELVEQLEEPETTFPVIPDIKESCKISTENGQTDQIKSKKDLERKELDKVNWKSDNPISSDLKNDSDMEHSQAASLSKLQQCQMANAIQQSSPSSGFSSAEQEKQHHEKEESNNTQPCSPTQGGESADPQPSSQMEEGNQKELATEHVRRDSPAESVTTDPTVLQEPVDSHTHAVDVSESSANRTNISQEKSNTDNVDSYSDLPQTTEQLVNLLDAKERSNQEKYVYLGVSTSDGTMDMLSVACEETIGGYDEDAMSTTSSCGATIAYPLSDGEDWDDQLEPSENDVSQPKSSQSSALQDSPNQITGGLHGKVVEHSSPVASCKWTVKFTKAKKRKRSRDRHHTKRKKKSHKKHKDNREKSKEQDKSHHKLKFIAVGDGTFKAVDAATRLAEKQDSEQKESSQSQHQEVTVGQESIQRVDDPLIGKENIEDLEEQKSLRGMQLVDNASCKLPIPKSPSRHHIDESGSAEASPHHEILISTRTDEKLESDPNSDEKPSNYVCEEKEVLDRSSEAVSVVPSSTKDETVIVDDDPCEQSTDQESCNPPVTTPLKNTVSHTQTPVPSGSLPSTHNITSVVEMQSNVPTSGFEANAQKEVGIMLHRAQISAEKDDVGAKTVQHISHDKATFFGAPRKDKSQMRPQLNIMHPALPYFRSGYITPGLQSSLFLPQHHVPMIPLRHPLNQSGACNELKQHLLRKQKLSVPDLQNRMHHPSQGQLAALDQRYLSPQNPKSSDIVTHPSERDLALKQLAELQRQTQLELEKQNTNAADRQKLHLMHQTCDAQPSQRDLPVHISSNPSRSQSFSNISAGLENKEGEKLLFPVNRVATAGIFSPPPADEQPRNLTKSQEQQNHKELESSRVRYTMPRTQQHVGFAADIPVFTAKGPEEQVLAVYADGCAPILQSEISPHFNLQQNLQPAVKSFPTPKEPHPNPGKITPTAGVDQDEMLKVLRQLHGGIATTRNFGVNRGELGSQTCSVPSESPHIVKNKGLNQIPGLIHLPLPTVTPVLHQPLHQPPEGYSSNVALTEIASQRKSVVDPMHVLYHPHTVQSSQDNPLTGAAINFPSTTSRTPTPKMHSRTPTPKSCPTYATYASESSTNLSLPHQPTTELERVSLSRTSTPRSHGTPSSTPHSASDSTRPGQTEFQKSHISQNISAPEEDMPLDLTCKGKAKIKFEQRPIVPLDLTCKQRKCDAESPEQNAVQVPYEVFEERDIQDTLSRSRSEQLPSNTVEQCRHESHALESHSYIQSQIAYSHNIYAPVQSVQDRSLQQHDDLSHQDLNVSGQFLNTDMLASKLRQMPEESPGAANYVLRSQQRMVETSVHEHNLARRANVYIDRAGPPHAFSELLHIGLTSEGPGLQIAKTYNTYVNPSTTSASSIPLIDLTSIPKTSLPFCELTRSMQVLDKNKEKISSTSKDHHLHHLQRTRSDDTEVRYSSSNSPHTSRTSQSESDKSQLDASSIASQNILSLPIDGLAESIQVPDENKAKISSTFKDPHLHVTHHLRRTRSDDTEVRYSSNNSPHTSRTSPSESNKSQLDASSIASQSILRSVSTSNNAVASTEPNLQGAESPQNLKSKILQSHKLSASDMSHCPKKRFKWAHEATLKESLSLSPSNMPADGTGSKMTEPVPQPHPSGSRKRGRPRGSKKTFEAYKPDVCVKEPCKFCEFEATSRQQMKNHVNDVHFQKYRTKPTSEKLNITSCSETCVDKDTGKHDSLTDECHTTVTPGTKLDALGSKVITNTSSKDGMRDGIGRNELSQEISEMLQTGADYCHHCDTYFPDTTSLAAHQRSRHKSLKFDFECRLCDFSDCEPGPLVVHINKMHLKELKGGPCPFQNCSRKFLTVREIKEHLNDHWIVKKYACKICGDRYHVLSSLKAHLDRHQQNLPNMCKDYHIYVTKWNVESASYEPIRA